ncbi:inorganic phosphate transporter, partial [[Eubacterium] cellulosolvens]
MAADFYLYVAVGLTTMLCAVLGGNNFSTCLGASLGAGIVKLSNAILIASAGVLLGTLLEGYKLSNVLDGQILPALSDSGLVAILVSSLLVMIVVTIIHLPLSLSQVTIGAGWGFALAAGSQVSGIHSLEVVASWIFSPALAFLASAVIEGTVLRLGHRIK